LCLNFARALQRVYGAGEFGQQTVTGGLDDSTNMGRNARINQLGSDGSQPPEGALLVGADQPRVPGYVGG